MRKITLELTIDDNGQVSIVTDINTIAKLLSVAPQTTVANAPKPRKKPAKYSKAFKHAALRRVINRRKDETVPQIAALVGMPAGTLQDWMNDLSDNEYQMFIEPTMRIVK